MFTTTESTANERISVIIYGESGTGKTTLAKTVPDKDRALIINAENGLLSLKGEKIPVYDITVDKDGNKLDRKYRFEKLIHLLKMLNTDEFKAKYDWLIFDSLTEITQCLVEFLKGKYPDKKDVLNVWGEYTDHVQQLAKEVRDFAPYNIVILALESVDKDESGRRFTGIDISGKVSMRIPALFDECFQLKTFTNEQGQQQRFLITSKYENNIVKDRSGKLNQFEEPNLTTIINKIHSTKGEANV